MAETKARAVGRARMLVPSLVTTCIARAALAQGGPDFEDMDLEEAATEHDEPGYDSVAYYPSLDEDERAAHGFVPRQQVAVLLGGGVTNFASPATTERIGPGGSWNVRAVLGTRQVFGLEAAYVGSALPVDSEAGNTVLLRHGGEALLRVQIPLAVDSGLVAPYVVGGLGWFRYGISNGSPAQAGLRTGRDETLETPVGGGLMIANGGFIIDARFTYRFSFNENLQPTRSDRADLDTWTLGGNIGWEF